MKVNLSNSSETNKIVHILSNILSNESFSQQTNNRYLTEFKTLLPKLKSTTSNFSTNNDKLIDFFTNVLAIFEKSRLVTFNQIKKSINHLKTLDTNFVDCINVLSANIKAYTLKVKNSFRQMFNNITESLDEILAMKSLFINIADVYDINKEKSVVDNNKLAKEKIRIILEHHDFLKDQGHQLNTIIKYADNLAINFYNEAKNTFKLIKCVHKGQYNLDNINYIDTNNEGLLINFSKESKSVPHKKRQKSRASSFINQSNMMVENSVFINNSCYTNITSDLSSINNTCPNNFNNQSLYNDHNINTFSLKHSNQNSQYLLRSNADSKSAHLSNNKKNTSSPKPHSVTSSMSISYSSDISVKEFAELILEFIHKMKLLQEAICRKDKNVSLFKKNFEIQKRGIVKLASTLTKNPISQARQSQIEKLEDRIKEYKEEINSLKEQKSQIRIIQTRMRELNSENDSLQQANESLIAQCNEMRAHIKKLDASNDSLMKYKYELNKISLRIKKIVTNKNKDSNSNPITASNNRLINIDNDNDNDTDLFLKKSLPSIEELIKENEANLIKIINNINNNSNNYNDSDNNSNHGSKNDKLKMKSTLADILMAINELIHLYSQDDEIESTFNIIGGNNNPINLLESSHRTLSKISNQSLSVPIIDQDFILSEIEKLKKILNDYSTKLKSLTLELNKKNSLSKSQFIYNDELSNRCGRTFTVEDLLNPKTDPRDGLEDDIMKIKNELIFQLKMKDKEIQKLNDQINNVSNNYFNEDDQCSNVMRLLSEEKEKNNEMKKIYLKTVIELMNKIDKVYGKRINEEIEGVIETNDK